MEELKDIKPLSENPSYNTAEKLAEKTPDLASDNRSEKLISQKQALNASQIPCKQCDNDIDVLHDADKIKLTPADDGSVTIITTISIIEQLIPEQEAA